MKIQTRNNIITFLMFISMALLISLGLIYGIELFQGRISTYPGNPYHFLQDYALFRLNFYAVVSSIFILAVYVFAFLLYINISFEKTRSTEIVYFSLFLIGCLMEPVRLLFSMLNLWDSCSFIAVAATRTIIFGRMLTPASLLFSVLYSNFESRQYEEQNILILVAFALGSALIAPLNSSFILPTGKVQTGLEGTFFCMRFLIFVISIIALTVKCRTSNMSASIPIGFSLLAIGYLLLTDSINFVQFGIGAPALWLGTYFYLKGLHSQYLWD